MSAPFEPSSLTVEFVSSAAGSGKTTVAVAKAAQEAKRGRKTIIALPTEDVIREWEARVRKEHPGVLVRVITSKFKADEHSPERVPKRICAHIETMNKGHILFITHAGLVLITKWPARKKEYHLIVDEVLDVILTNKPFEVPYSYFQVGWFLDVVPVPDLAKDGKPAKPITKDRLFQAASTFSAMARFAAGAQGAGAHQADDAKKHLPRKKAQLIRLIREAPDDLISDKRLIRALTEAAELLGVNIGNDLFGYGNILSRLKTALGGDDDADKTGAYYQIVSKPDPNRPNDPHWQTELRAINAEKDQVFRTFKPIPALLLQPGVCLFASKKAYDLLKPPKEPEGYSSWEHLLSMLSGNVNPEFAEYKRQKDLYYANRGRLSITGFRRPDFLEGFAKVTIMSALFEHSALYMMWKSLGVRFVPSTEIPLAVKTVPLANRKVKIYWATPHGWSKRTRQSIPGGITTILEIIRDKGVIDASKPVCAVVNKEDGDSENDGVVKAVFPNAKVLDHHIWGSNNYREYDQLMYLPSLNSATPDIKFIERRLNIHHRAQRIARLGFHAYQTFFRLSVRDPTATADIILVVMDKDIAEWLAAEAGFPPQNVEVFEIDTSGVIRPRKKGGARMIGDHVMSARERQQRRRAKISGKLPPAESQPGGAPA